MKLSLKTFCIILFIPLSGFAADELPREGPPPWVIQSKGEDIGLRAMVAFGGLSNGWSSAHTFKHMHGVDRGTLQSLTDDVSREWAANVEKHRLFQNRMLCERTVNLENVMQVLDLIKRNHHNMYEASYYRVLSKYDTQTSNLFAEFVHDMTNDMDSYVVDVPAMLAANDMEFQTWLSSQCPGGE